MSLRSGQRLPLGYSENVTKGLTADGMQEVCWKLKARCFRARGLPAGGRSQLHIVNPGQQSANRLPLMFTEQLITAIMYRSSIGVLT